jgi:hypothetical protein
MVNTRNNNANGKNNNVGNPPPALEQVLVIQAQMLQTMVNLPQHQQAPQLHQRDRLRDFQRTNAPHFLHSMEPMNTDDWLNAMEKKLQLVQCNNREKVLLASQ